MGGLAAAGLGFLLAVLWFDLMFDVQAWASRRSPADIPERVVDSVATYYRRVTTDARPMNRLVAVAMLATLGALVATVVRGGARGGEIAALVLTALPIGYAAVRIVPAAVRLGAATDDLATRQTLVRRILVGHVACWLSIASALVVVLTAVA